MQAQGDESWWQEWGLGAQAWPGEPPTSSLSLFQISLSFELTSSPFQRCITEKLLEVTCLNPQGQGAGGGGWTRLYSFKQTSLWCQSFSSPPYSISAGEPSDLFFWMVNLWWVRSTWIAFTEQHFPLAVFVLAVVEIDGVLLWVTKPREGGGGCFGRYIFSGRCPSPQLTAAFRSQIINNKDSAFRSQGNK